ncbi:hypothetical protein [Nostoc sp.]|uniref:hypothetical protein n=1 Tax=Nostoc sp. TaxID=1180 RepID=UPI002FF54AE7
MKKIANKILHPRKERQRRKEQDRQEGESSMQATTPARSPSQSGSVSKLTLDRFLSGLEAQNGSKDSLTADAQNREKSDTYAPRFMLHGTSKSNADNIEQTGLQTSYGGQEGGASTNMNDPKYIENSQGVVHGTPSRRTARTYGQYHTKLSAAGKSGGERSIQDNSAFIGFEAEDPKSINRDDDSDAGYKVSQSLPPNKVVRIPNEIIEETFDPTNPIPS